MKKTGFDKYTGHYLLTRLPLTPCFVNITFTLFGKLYRIPINSCMHHIFDKETGKTLYCAAVDEIYKDDLMGKLKDAITIDGVEFSKYLNTFSTDPKE